MVVVHKSQISQRKSWHQCILLTISKTLVAIEKDQSENDIIIIT